MKTIDAIERELGEALPAMGSGAAAARWLLGLAEQVLEVWVTARGAEPTSEEREGFRLLALHRQGAQDLPSFNACRETCREICYHYNLLALPAPPEQAAQRLKMMGLLVRHLALFVGGKLEVERLGEFCCASKPLRADDAKKGSDPFSEKSGQLPPSQRKGI